MSSAKYITIGDQLTYYGRNNTTASVISTRIIDTLVTVYNFEVKDNHNYYVSKFEILVHNQCKVTAFDGDLTGDLIDGLHLEGTYSVSRGHADFHVRDFEKDPTGPLAEKGAGMEALTSKFEGLANASESNNVRIVLVLQ